MLAAGLIIDEKFELIRQIGAGSYGEIFEASQLGLDRKVALKILRATEIDWETSKRLLREASILSEIQHRNIVTVYGYGNWQGSPYIAMEYLDGRSLGDQLELQERLLADTAIDVLLQVCDALSCAHAHGIVHRDLKPDNVFVIKSELNQFKIKLIDFGLAKDLLPDTTRSVQQLTDLGLVVGTVSHMSPEQCQGIPADQRSDIYAVGCMLYECLTGKLPYTGESPLAIMMKHTSDETPKLREVLGETPSVTQLQFILDRCMEKEPEERYESAEALKADLLAFRKGHNLVPATTEPQPKRETRSSRSSETSNAQLRKALANKAGWIAFIAIFLLLAPLVVRAFMDEHISSTAAYVFSAYQQLPANLRDHRVESWCLQASTKGSDVSAKVRLLTALWDFRRRNLKGHCDELADIACPLVQLHMQLGNQRRAHLVASLTCDDIGRDSYRSLSSSVLEKMYELCLATHNRARASFLASRLATTYDEQGHIDEALSWYNRVFELTDTKIHSVFNRRLFRARLRCSGLYDARKDIKKAAEQLTGACQQLSRDPVISDEDAILLGKAVHLMDEHSRLLEKHDRAEITDSLRSALSFVLVKSMNAEARKSLETSLPN